jgi:hypothetical protein
MLIILSQQGVLITLTNSLSMQRRKNPF